MKTNIFNKQKKFEQEVLSGEYAVGDMEYSSYYKDSFKRLKKNKMSMFCLIVIVLLILIAIFAPLIAPSPIILTLPSVGKTVLAQPAIIILRAFSTMQSSP